MHGSIPVRSLGAWGCRGPGLEVGAVGDGQGLRLEGVGSCVARNQAGAGCQGLRKSGDKQEGWGVASGCVERGPSPRPQALQSQLGKLHGGARVARPRRCPA